jgi:hypothetical protein
MQVDRTQQVRAVDEVQATDLGGKRTEAHPAPDHPHAARLDDVTRVDRQVDLILVPHGEGGARRLHEQLVVQQPDPLDPQRRSGASGELAGARHLAERPALLAQVDGREVLHRLTVRDLRGPRRVDRGRGGPLRTAHDRLGHGAAQQRMAIALDALGNARPPDPLHDRDGSTASQLRPG